MADSLVQLSEVSVAEMIESLAAGIAEAQFELDMTSTRVAEMLAGTYRDEDKPDEPIDTRVTFGGERLSLMALGFTPSFYQFVETIIEVKVSVSMTRETTSESARSSTTKTTEKKRHGFLGTGGTTTRTMTTTVSARYSSRFQYSVEGASVIRTRLVPVPPPSMLEARMIQLAQENESS